MKIRYIRRDLKPSSLKVIEQANVIIEGYMEQGFRLTLRQLYYQFVSRDLLANTVQNYKRLGSIINDGRLAGLIDWDAIEDRTRETTIPSTWNTPSSILEVVADQFRIDKWRGQKYRPEVWIEKEALAGVIEPVCSELQISFLCCRGYTSQSEMWSSAQRLLQMKKRKQTPFILHLGDHDPSGIDMTRDIQDRLELFTHGAVKLERLALNMNQIEQYNPPPNPAKQTDARFTGYMAQFGVDESWELDALEPTVLADLIRKTVLEWRDETKWESAVDEENAHRELLEKTSDRWEDVVNFLNGDE